MMQEIAESEAEELNRKNKVNEVRQVIYQRKKELS